MSDMMQKVGENQSIFNPADAAMMSQTGKIRPDMTIREFFEQQGVDVDGPLTQLAKMGRDQAMKAKPQAKAQALGGQPAPEAPAGPPPGLDQMISSMGR